MKDRISLKTFYTNLLGSGALSRASDPTPVLPMATPRKSRFWTFVDIAGLLIAFGLLIAVGAALGFTLWGN